MRSSAGTVACLHSEGRLYVAHAPSDSAVHGAASAVTELIQGIYALDPKFARKIVRGRIFTDGPRTERDWGMVNVSAKTVSFETPQPLETCRAMVSDLLETIEVSFWNENTEGRLDAPQPPASEIALWKWLDAESMRASDLGPLHARDRKVAAALVGPDGECLGLARNTNAGNRTLHAEVNLVQNWVRAHRRPLPPGARVLTTLQPCRMCAGLIWNAAEDPRSITVTYRDVDPGPKAIRTCLELAGVLRKLT